MLLRIYAEHPLLQVFKDHHHVPVPALCLTLGLRQVASPLEGQLDAAV